MATQLQIRRGNTAQTSVFTGVLSEITVDTDKNTVVVHDGLTTGGHPLALEITTQAAFDKANASFDAANGDLTFIAGELSSNVQFIAAVNASQNTNINYVVSHANAAYDQANTNSSSITTLQDVNVTQNNSISVLQSVNTTQNTRLSGVETLSQASFDAGNTTLTYAQSGYAKANTNATNIATIQAVDTTQNTNITSATTLAQSAFDAGNTTTTYSQTSFAHANSAFDKANNGNVLAQASYDQANTNHSDIVVIQDVNTTQNTNIGLVDNKAQAAFDAANNAVSGTASDGWARSKANGAFDKANTVGSDLATANTFLQANDATTLATAKSYTDTAVSNLVNSAPTTLDTLKELSDALGADANFATTVSNNIGLVRNNANAAYDLANTNAGAITVIQAVNVTQNTNISSADDKAQAAFDAGNTTTTYAQSAYAKANTNASAITVLQDVDSTQNTRLGAVETLSQASFDTGNTTLTYAQSGYAKANADGILAQASFDKANTNASNITVIEDVNTTQNTRLTAVETLTQSSFDAGNTTTTYAQSAYAKANTNAGDISVIQSVNTTQNNSILVLQSVDVTQNTRLGAVETLSQASFDAGNTTLTYAQAGYAKANTVTSDLSTANTWLQANDATTLATAKSYTDTAVSNLVNSAPATLDTLKELADALGSDASFSTTISNNIGLVRNHSNSAYDQANTNSGAITVIQAVNTTQNNSISVLQSVNDTQNSAITVIQEVDTTQNTNITAADTKAQAAFDAANNAVGGTAADGWARSKANGAFDKANSTITIGNTATYLGNTYTSIEGLSSVGFNASAGFSVGQGQIAWNNTDRTFDMGLYNGSVLQVGQETHMLIKANNNITNGQTVMFVGANGDNILGDVCNTAVPGFSTSYFIGVATQNITANDFGYVTIYGKVHGLNTNSYNAGDILWVDNNTPGALTTTHPAVGTPHIQVAAVTKKSGGDGHLMVRPTIWPSLNDLSNFQDDATKGQVLEFNGSVWAPTSNVLINQAVNTTQNTSISYAFAHANSAYNEANTGVTIAQSSYDSGNITLTYAQSGYAKANTVASDLATANTFLQANDSITLSSAIGYTNTANGLMKLYVDSANNFLQTYTDSKVSNLVNSAPSTLDTLKELADALGNDANLSTTLTTMISGANSVAHFAESYAITGFAHANSAYDAANSSNLLAQNAFDKANTSATLQSFSIEGAGSETATYSAMGPDYGNTSEIMSGLIYFYSPTGTFQSVLQSLTGTETIEYTSYGSTYTTTLTSPFTYTGSRWEASAVNTGGSYVDTVKFITVGVDTLTYNNSTGVFSLNLSSYATKSNTQAAFDTANASFNASISAGSYANTGINLAQAAFDSGNNTSTLAQAAFDSGNNTSTLAQAAFDTANSAGTYANTGINLSQAAFDSSNSSGSYANTGINLAQAAYNYANTVTDTIYLANNATISDANTEISTVVANTVIDSFALSSYRTMKYLVQAVNAEQGKVHSSEALLVHDDLQVYINEYGTVKTDTLYTLDATIDVSNASLVVTPTYANTTVHIVRMGIPSYSLGGTTSGDMMTLSGTEDLLTGSGSEDLMV